MQLRRDPFDERREATDRAAGADDRRHALHRLGPTHTGLLSDGLDRSRIREDEVAGVVEDPHRRRAEHGGAEHDVSEWILGVLAGHPAAGEERLQGLRGQLDHPLAVEPSRPAALEEGLLRAEHAQLHRSFTGAPCARRRRRSPGARGG